MTVTNLNLEKKYPKVAELQERIDALILEYDGEIGFLETLGMLEFLKSIVIKRQWDNIVGDD